uniref:Uncharacterized protein n=1 Tax=Caenorhabditis japonica TaxID=281687 RepID=A0A8R1E849_CAEJA
MPTDHHSFLVKIEKETKRKRVDLENIYRSHRRLVDHMVFVELLNDRLRAFSRYIKLTNGVTTHLDKRFVEMCDQEIVDYSRNSELVLNIFSSISGVALLPLIKLPDLFLPSKD